MSTAQGGGERGPKLFTRKPTKAQVKQSQRQQQKASPFPTPPPPSSSMAASQHSSTAAPPPPPPPPLPKESFARRYKFLWPLVLGVNFVVGAYLFTRTSKKDVGLEGEVPDVPATPISTTAAAEKPLTSPPVVEPVKLRDPIPEKEQRELFKWILEEKRKVKPKDPQEKKRIDEEKAILKQFIRAKSIPSL